MHRVPVGPEGPLQRTFVLVGGAGFVGTAVTDVLRAGGAQVVVVDRRRPRRSAQDPGVRWIECDLLTDDVVLPDGELVILAGSGDPRPRWSWTLPMDIAVTTARLLPALRGGPVTPPRPGADPRSAGRRSGGIPGARTPARRQPRAGRPGQAALRGRPGAARLTSVDPEAVLADAAELPAASPAGNATAPSDG